MNQQFILFQRAGVYYCEDKTTGKQTSLRTKDKGEALTLLNARNESTRQPVLNLRLARVYLAASDPLVSTRTWQHVMDEIIRSKDGANRDRWTRAAKSKSFDAIRARTLIDTQAEHLLDVLHKGTVSTNVYLRRLHNFAIDMNWLPASIIPKRQWPAVRFKEKRAITLDEHQRIIAAEGNPERKGFYQLCWHLGASQSDLALLKAEAVDWTNATVSFFRKKTGVPVIVHLGQDALRLLEDLPSEGFLFPYLASVRAGDRSTEFGQRCRLLGIAGVSLHSYRYSWAERAKSVGYPERFAQEALGHGSKAVHRAYAKRALVKIPSLEDYERQAAQAKPIGV